MSKMLIILERIAVALENIAASLCKMEDIANQAPMAIARANLLDLDADPGDAGSICHHPNQPLITTGGTICPDCGALVHSPGDLGNPGSVANPGDTAQECKHPYYHAETKECGACGEAVNEK